MYSLINKYQLGLPQLIFMAMCDVFFPGGTVDKQTNAYCGHWPSGLGRFQLRHCWSDTSLIVINHGLTGNNTTAICNIYTSGEYTRAAIHHPREMHAQSFQQNDKYVILKYMWFVRQWTWEYLHYGLLTTQYIMNQIKF